MHQSKATSAPAKPNVLDKLKTGLNHYQQQHAVTGFIYAVIKKYGDDEAAYQAALITYYGFLSLFPLLIVATSLIEIIAGHNQHLQAQLINGFSNYFPGFGDQLQSHVHGQHKTGVALVIGLLLTLYGARGGAAAVQHALNHIWLVPRKRRAGFPLSPLKSLALIIFGGSGLLLTAVLSSVATNLNHSLLYKIVPISISIVLLFIVFMLVYKLGTDEKKIGYRDVALAALITSIGLQILQTLGGYYVTHQLKSLSALYGTFALVLGLLAWIYLQAQVAMYAVEVSAVHALKLWPRSMDDKQLTPQDELAYKLHAQKERLVAEEYIAVKV